MEVDQTTKDLLKAADLIKTNGHAKHLLETAGGQFCIRGAILAAVGYRNMFRLDSYPDQNHPLAKRYHAAETRVSKFLGVISHEEQRNRHTTDNAFKISAAGWNNLSERTQEQVVQALIESAYFENTKEDA